MYSGCFANFESREERQCSKPCHADTYDNYELLKSMYETQKDMQVFTALIQHCPKCGAEMDFNLFWDDIDKVIGDLDNSANKVKIH